MAGRAIDRLVNFSDGVVAVAVTVMILPIVDVPGPQGSETMLDVVGANAGLLVSYVFTFYVIVSMWLAHHRVFNELRGYDQTIVALNTVWLMTIGFLPWPSHLIGDGDGIENGIGALYFGTLALSTLMLLLIGLHVKRSPDLLLPHAQVPAGGTRRSVAFLVFFVVLAVASLLFGAAANWLMVALPVISIAMRPRRMVSTDVAAAPGTGASEPAERA